MQSWIRSKSWWGLTLLLAAGPAWAGEGAGSPSSLVWASLALGLPFVACGDTVSSGALYYQHGRNQFSLRGTHWSDAADCTGSDLAAKTRAASALLLASQPCMDAEEGSEDQLLWDAGALYGWTTTRSRWVRFSGAAGLAVGRSQEVSRSGCGGDKSSTVGVPVELRMLFTPLPVLGIGWSVSADFNPKESRGAFLMELHFGRLR